MSTQAQDRSELVSLRLEDYGIERGSIEDVMLTKVGHHVDELEKDVLLSSFFFDKRREPESLPILPDEVQDIDIETKVSPLDISTDLENLETKLELRMPRLTTKCPVHPLSSPTPPQKPTIDFYGFKVNEGEFIERQPELESIPLEKCHKYLREWDVASEDRKKRVCYLTL